MAEFKITEEWVDRYLRDELDDDQRDAFELELMNSRELSDALMSAMGVQKAVELEEQYLPRSDTDQSPLSSQPQDWQTWAMAACLVLAIFSTTMYWRTGNEVSSLTSELKALRNPIGNVLAVPVEIMRSGGELEAPRAVAVPEGVDLVLLDIEIPQNSAKDAVLNMQLTSQDGEEIMSWQSSPLPSGNHNVAIRANLLPRGQVVLEARDVNGDLIYRRLLEFR